MCLKDFDYQVGDFVNMERIFAVSMCENCSANIDFQNVRGKFLGHVDIWGDNYDKIELTRGSRRRCQGCQQVVTHFYPLCKLGSSRADDLFEEAINSNPKILLGIPSTLKRK